MSMFDSVNCDYPLSSPEDRVYITRSFNCNCDLYHISEDGKLYIQSISWKKDTLDDELQVKEIFMENFSDTVIFYDNDNDDGNDSWWRYQYKMIFIHGNIVFFEDQSQVQTRYKGE